MRKRSARSGFDLDFRPESYFSQLDAATLVVASILGEERRKDVQRRLATGDFDPMVWGEWLTDSKLDESTRRLLGRCDPRFMGGEYLPALRDNEIEIARIVLASVTQDVASVRARRAGKRIAYRVVDEYESVFVLARKSSARPLTLRELIQLIDDSAHSELAPGLVFPHLDFNFDDSGDPDSVRDFVTVSSSFYPELGSYYALAIDAHLDELLSEARGVGGDTD